VEKHLDDPSLVEAALLGESDRIDPHDLVVVARADEGAERVECRDPVGETSCDRIEPLAEDPLVRLHRR
jgi:hypothetical protein